MNFKNKKSRSSDTFGKRPHTQKRSTNANRKKSSLNPNLLVQKAKLSTAPVFKSQLEFDAMNICKGLKTNLSKLGFASPTEIQERTIEQLIEKRNLIGIANTGTGKTGAFLIPIIENLHRSEHKFKSLIIVPTRELALQVEAEFRKMAEGLGYYASCFIGGTNIGADISKLRRNNDIIIGTPGRLLDLKNRGNLRLDQFEVLVLDEFDRMLDMGFIADIRKIIGAMSRRKQTVLFSATRDKSQQALIDEMVKNPIIVEVNMGDSSSENVDQEIIRVPEGKDKYEMLLSLLKGTGFEKIILFAETKRLADRLSNKLNKSGIKADQIHGNKSQNYRVKALAKFKSGKVKVLVATDVAARGIDVNDVSHVINYQIPMDFDTYIHRIGRTGRAGKSGTAYTFVD